MPQHVTHLFSIGYDFRNRVNEGKVSGCGSVRTAMWTRHAHTLKARAQNVFGRKKIRDEAEFLVYKDSISRLGTGPIAGGASKNRDLLKSGRIFCTGVAATTVAPRHWKVNAPGATRSSTVRGLSG